MVAFALFCFLHTGLAQFLSCSWIDPESGASFNLRPLYRNAAQGDYTGTDGQYLYSMNICGASNAGGDCTSQGGLLCQFKTDNTYEATVASWTKTPRPTWSLINKANPALGVDLFYQNGDNCYDNNLPRNTNMTFYCDPHAPVTTQFAIYENPGDTCTYYVSYTSPFACPQSDIPVNRLSSGEFVLDSASSGTWKYYSIDVGLGMSQLQVTTSQTSVGGFVQLYVRFSALPTELAYDRADLGNTNTHYVNIRTDDPPSSNPLQPGFTYYIGVKAMYGDVSYALTPYTFQCFGNCSGAQGTCVVSGDGGYECECAPGYDSNFDDCSAQVVMAYPGRLYNGTLVNSGWRYYKIDVQGSYSYQLFVELNRVRSDPGTALPTLMIKKGDWPTYASNDGIVQDITSPSTHWELEVMYPKLTPGYWIVAVVGSWDTTFNYNLQVNIFDCDHNCSSHGVCSPSNNTCTCNPGYGDTDCSLEELQLVTGTPFNAKIPPYSTSYFTIVVPSFIGHVDLIATVDCFSPFYPLVLINPAASGVPTESKNLYSSPLPQTQLTSLRVSAYSIETANSSKWYLGVVSYGWGTMDVNITVTYDGYCPNDCSNNGVCVVSETSIYCNCTAGFEGGGCDVMVGSNSSSDGVDDGTFAGIVIAFVFVGLVLGYGIKTKFPQLCQSKSERLTSTTTHQTQYSAISEAS